MQESKHGIKIWIATKQNKTKPKVSDIGSKNKDITDLFGNSDSVGISIWLTFHLCSWWSNEFFQQMMLKNVVQLFLFLCWLSCFFIIRCYSPLMSKMWVRCCCIYLCCCLSACPPTSGENMALSTQALTVFWLSPFFSQDNLLPLFFVGALSRLNDYMEQLESLLRQWHQKMMKRIIPLLIQSESFPCETFHLVEAMSVLTVQMSLLGYCCHW